ncbi:MAG: radical SAM family heme chaperone HemW [Dehalococcoidia bacterium]|jgi:oxygen-independent coproporphyrinogen-3 oxidase
MSECRSVYVHIPFCRAKCAYCDFNSYARQERLIPEYVEALLREATFWAEKGAVGRVDTLYFGGGTPSLLPAAEAERLLAGLRRLFAIADDAEITFEANPESASPDQLRALRRIGVNRLSLGIQSFDDGELRLLGRIHDAATAEAAFRAARKAGFDAVSLDLIFGLPGQSLAAWRRSLERAVELAPEHLSLYALTLEDGTPLARRVARGECAEPDADTQADMYDWSSERLASAGYEQYEISNWARSGRRCRHNLTYWRCEPYLGLGAGAHSYLGDWRFANAKSPRRYISAIERLGAMRTIGSTGAPAKLPQVRSAERLDAATALADALILGLRLNDGVSRESLGRRFGVDVGERYRDEIAYLTEVGLLESVDGCMRLTARGRLLGNEVFQRFLP